MSRCPILLVLLLAMAGCRPAAKNSSETFYVQLVQGSNKDVPPTEVATPAGEKLQASLNRTFRWKHYWELKRDSMVVPRGEAVRRTLSSERTVQIELLDAKEMKVRVYSAGALVRCRRQPVANAFCVSGGNCANGDGWFVVVRRDKPQEVEPASARLLPLR